MKALTRSDFIKKAKAFHGSTYTYGKVSYTTNKAKVNIKCPTHGYFLQRAAEHLAGSGCYDCAAIHNTSQSENEWLDNKRISKGNRQKRLMVKGKTFLVDAYIPKSKTVYEFYGDIWHGNPDTTESNDTNPVNGISYGELYAKTISREKALKRAGYKVVSIWESDWLEDNQ